MNEFSIFWAFARAYQWCLTCKEKSLRDFPGGAAGEAKTLRSQCKGPGLLPGRGTRSHMPQLRVCMPHLKTLHAPTEDLVCVCVCVCVCVRAPTKDPVCMCMYVCVCVCVCVCVWVAQSFRHFGPHGLQPSRLLCPWDSLGKNTGAVCHSLLQGIFRDQTQVFIYSRLRPNIKFSI